MVTIFDIKARQVFDSRGIPTVEAELRLTDGSFGRFITPSGASVGSKEALELRDGDPSLFLGRGVKRAVLHVNQVIKEAVLGRSFRDQADFDRLLIDLDGTDNKSNLGANAVLAASGAFFHAWALAQKLPLYRCIEHEEPWSLPLPLVNVINGGAHADNALDVQEFMIVPSGAKTFHDSLQMVAETFYALKAILAAEGFSTAVGDEGGFAPNLSSNEQALSLLLRAIEKAGYRPGQDIKLALDVAASELYQPQSDSYRLEGRMMDRSELLSWYEKMAQSYPICSIEDPFHEDDFLGFASMVKSLGSRMQIVGDDLFVTNEKYIRQGIEQKLANAVLIKMNQIGSISETLQAIGLTKDAGFNAIISHRSGDSEDTTIADLAVLTRASQIKTGSMSRSERVAKYNRLLRIEEELGSLARFKPVL